MIDKKLIFQTYKKHQLEIDKKLENFEKILKKGKDMDIFLELAMCILTPQSKPENCWGIICNLKKDNKILYLEEKKLSSFLNTARFKNRKAEYLVLLRENFLENGEIKIRDFILENKNDIYNLRLYLYENIKGIGIKEASHFLRNIGLGKNLAILDRHILFCLKTLGIICDIPNNLSYTKYIDIEKKMQNYSKDINISMDKLDLILWYIKTGRIFK